MSGIAGIIHFDGKLVEPGLVKKMTSAMSYRGPDGINHWTKGSVAMGQCMLCTTPESLEENQPLTNEDESLILVMDGRVDNWEELRKELLRSGAVLRNRADAELVLRSYEIWGEDCLTHIDGDFALVICDAKRQIAFCTRDRVGNKPFYYYWHDKTLVFSSELHNILALPWVKQELNQGMLAEFLACEWYSRDETCWQGIMRLVSAHYMIAGMHGLKTQQYWSPDLSHTLPYTKDEEFVECYLELFTDIVRRMSRSHKALACEVSGGLDSSAIFAVAEQLHQQHILQAPSIEGYTLDFHDNIAANELKYAREVGRHCDKEIREILPSSLSISKYRQWTEHYRVLPPYPHGAMGLSIRAEASSRGSRALMTGVGGDEWLWGDRSYYAGLLANSKWQELYHCLKKDFSNAGYRDSIWWLARYGVVPLFPDIVKDTLRKVNAIAKCKVDNKQEWLSPLMRTLLQQRQLRYNNSMKFKTVRVGLREQFRLLYSATGPFAREAEELLAASEGIELRRPYWHPKIIQFAFSTPPQRRLQGNVDRVIHRQAMVGLLPKAVLERKTKADFMITFQAPLKALHEDFNEHISMRRSTWIDPHQATQLWNMCGRTENGGWPEFRLWTLFGCHCLADV